MTTNKRRINISTDRNTEETLEKIARRDGVPLATKAAEMLRAGLEMVEDAFFVSIAEDRMKKNVKRIPHNLAWK